MKFSLSLILFAGLFLASIAFDEDLQEDDDEFADFENFDEVPVKIQPKEVTPNEFDDNSDDGVEIEDEFDRDEFEGFGADSDDLIGADSKKPVGEPRLDPKLMESKVPHFRRDWDSYWVEILFLAGLVVYFINYAMGKNKNSKIANSWLNAHKSFLEENFALVGDDGKKETDISQSAGVMLKESDSIFTLWCSGRVCVEGMLVELKLIKRQDLLSRAIAIMSPSSKVQDQVIIKAEISKDSMDSFVFAVCSKKSASKMFKDVQDLKQYCVSVVKADEKYNLPANFSVLSEIAEASQAILDARLIAMLHKYNTVIDYIHITDQYSGNLPEQEGSQPMKQPDTKKMLIVSFFISEKTDIEEMRPLLQLVIYLIDKLKRFKLSREGKSKADKNRLRVEEEFLKSSHAMRMEAAAQKREEKRKQEKEKIMNEDNVEKQIKLERKMKKKDAKKAQPKMKSMSIHL